MTSPNQCYGYSRLGQLRDTVRRKLNDRRRKQQLPDGALTSSQVAACCGVSLRNLQWWDERGIISPAQVGHMRYYTAKEAAKCAVVGDLRRKRLSLRACRLALGRVDFAEPGDVIATADGGKSWSLFHNRGAHTEEAGTRALDFGLQARGAVVYAVVPPLVRL